MDLPREIAAVRGELARADAKAATLAGLVGTAVSIAGGLAAVSATRLPMSAQIALWATITLLAAALLTLLLSIRPSLPRPGAGFGWVAHAYATPEALAAVAGLDTGRTQYAELIGLARLARTKYVRIRTAVDLLLTALGTAVPTTILIITGGAS
ncbi:Pycsar system effector family protein [Streptosporangium sp. NPDC020145]|uniref:Pycsar system effector family protein n=1 Tax=Streptosporangium sp. NPDC020145 TaxID=3154694 RepID=UPI003441F9B1